MSSSPVVSSPPINIVEELQVITAQNLEKLEVNKYYEVIRELGKGTYGKVDLVIHKMRGENTYTFTHTPAAPTVMCLRNRLCGVTYEFSILSSKNALICIFRPHPPFN